MSKWPTKIKKVSPGVYTTQLASWIEFNDIINKLVDLPQYVFRGHRRDDWLLEPTLVRLIKHRDDPKRFYDRHIENFQYALRGRRGPNPPALKDEKDIWALGQHNWLATPLLDWSESPYVALFFAFADASNESSTEYRTVFCLNEKRVSDIAAPLWEEQGPDADDLVEFHRPMSDENARLVSQAGLFSLSTGMTDIETWVANHASPSDHKVILLKVQIPDTDRLPCIKALNKMNINYASLFPDIFGACKHANMKLEIEHY